MTSIRRGAALAVALVLAAAAGAVPYQETPVPNGGQLAGSVRYSGPLLPPLESVVTADQRDCGPTVPSHFFRVGSTRGLRDAIVTIEGISAGKALSRETRPVLANRKCQFEPHVQAVPVGSKIDLVNEDPISHNAHGVLDGARTLFNVALPIKGFRLPKVLTAPGLVSVRCESGHTWMGAYILVVDHPYYAVTDSTGTFSMTDVPPGTYRVKAWHEAVGTQEQEVTIRPGSRTDLAFEYATAPTLPADVRATPPPEDEF